MVKYKLVGCFNPFENYWLNWIISPGKGKHLKKNVKPPPSMSLPGTNKNNKPFREV